MCARIIPLPLGKVTALGGSRRGPPHFEGEMLKIRGLGGGVLYHPQVLAPAHPLRLTLFLPLETAELSEKIPPGFILAWTMAARALQPRALDSRSPGYHHQLPAIRGFAK